MTCTLLVTILKYGQLRSRKTHGPARGHKWSRTRHRDSGRVERRRPAPYLRAWLRRRCEETA
eukprot:5047496-Prymnesium_polylepis.1